jgi:secreted Zn-dependent insulinase-like peptidase
VILINIIIIFFNLVDILSINKLFFIKEKNINENKNNIITYLLKKEEFNPKEINNCIYDCMELKNIKIKLFEDKIKFKYVKKIIKYELIFDIIASLINEPLFDKIRTTDKLGYIVKCTSKYYLHNNHYNYLIIYVVQSTFNLDKINDSINSFNDFFKNDFIENNKKYKEKYLSIKNSKILEYTKKYSNLQEEVSYYINSIFTKINIFSLKKIYLEILKKIKFNDIIRYINKIFNKDINKNFKIIIDVETK